MAKSSKIRNIVLAIMERESKKYYIDMYGAFANRECINEILKVARHNGDIKERIYIDEAKTKSGNIRSYHLRKAIRDQIFETDRLFIDKENLERFLSCNGPAMRDRVPFSKTTIEDAICFLEDVVYYTRLILIAAG